MIRPELLMLLRCPRTHQKLSLAAPELIEALNARIKARQLQTRAGKVVDHALEGGLLCEDGSWLYPIRADLPILLIDAALPASN